MAPQRKVFSKSFDLTNMSVSIATDSRAETFETAHLTDEIKAKLLLHGMVQKLSDATASSAGSLSIDEKWTAILETYGNLSNGEWSSARESMGSLLFRALCELTPNKDKVVLKDWLVGKTPAEKRALELNPKVAKVLRKLESEKTSAVDSNALLEELF